jgi:hypothetical protein
MFTVVLFFRANYFILYSENQEHDFFLWPYKYVQLVSGNLFSSSFGVETMVMNKDFLSIFLCIMNVLCSG